MGRRGASVLLSRRRQELQAVFGAEREERRDVRGALAGHPVDLGEERLEPRPA
jgi:hypothetical protein